MRIHTVGDSHSHCAWPDYVIPHHLGAILCYSFGKEKLERCDLRELDIEDGDTVIFCFGEIDCRCHIHKCRRRPCSGMGGKGFHGFV